MDVGRRAVGLTAAAVRAVFARVPRSPHPHRARPHRAARVLPPRRRAVADPSGRPGWLVRAGAFVAVCALAVLGPATPAIAGPCTNAPTPEAPGQGIAGFFLPTPNPIPTGEDPFAPGAKTTPFEQYGLAGLSWYLYDPGCGGAVRDPSGSISSWAGRTLFIPAKAGVSSLVAVSGAALQPSYLGAFDPLISSLTAALHGAIFTPLAPLAVMLTGLLLMARSTRQRVSESTTAVGWALLVMIVAAALFAWPVKAGHAADRAITTSVGLVSKGLTSSDEPPGRQVANQLYNSFMYRMWLTGEFCDPDSHAAKKYGPDLLKAQAFSWQEARQAASQGSGAFVLTHKAQFDGTAAKIKSEDPVAYECVAGHTGAPLEASILGDVGVLLMAPFLLIGGLILIAAYIIIRFAVILAPAMLTAGAFFPLRGIVQGAARVVAAALINSVVFTVCTLFVIRVDTTVLDPATNLPGWLRLVLLGVVTVVMWYLTRPFRKLTTMITPRGFAEGLSEAGAGWRARAGGFLRRRQRREDMREAFEEALEDSRQLERAEADGRTREEARGPVSMPRRVRVTAERVARAEAAGYSLGTAAGLPPPGASPAGSVPGRDALTALPLAGVHLTLGADDDVLALDTGASPGRHELPPAVRVPVTAYRAEPDGSGERGERDDRDGSPPRYLADHEPPGPAVREREPVAPPARQAEYAAPRRVPAQARAEGLFDPSAPYWADPEDDPRGHLRHVQAEVVDGEEVYRLYDPGTDPLAGYDPWSR